MNINPSGWIEDISQCPSPNFNQRPSAVSIDLLVIHNISLPPNQFGSGHIQAFFQNKLDYGAHPYYHSLEQLKVSAHFLIDRTGTLIQFVSLLDRAWHAGVSSFAAQENCNDYSIGIELEGSDSITFTDAQYETLTVLTQSLRCVYPKITQERIVGHSDIALPIGRKTDPGPHFDWIRYYQSLKASPK